MKKKSFIQVKAAFLLIVFALNTVIGFACAIGMDMGFNSSTHHHDEDAVTAPVHVHENAKKHVHHHNGDKHRHDENKASKKDGCCNDKVIKFETTDKNLSQTAKADVNPTVFVSLVSIFFGVDFFTQIKIAPQQNLAFFHPPPPDILIAIQQFRI